MSTITPVEVTDETLIEWLEAYAENHGYNTGEEPEERHFHQFGGRAGGDSANEVTDVAAALAENVPTFGYNYTPDDWSQDWIVKAYVNEPEHPGMTLARYAEGKHIGDGESRGMDFAVSVARDLIAEYNIVAAFAARYGIAQTPDLEPVLEPCVQCDRSLVLVDRAFKHDPSVGEADAAEADADHEGEPGVEEVRASELETGHVYREFGLDEYVHVARRDDHGDRVLIYTADGIEHSLDSDEAVELVGGRR